ncbi:hypothetical protein [Salinisphaera dokdonensis]
MAATLDASAAMAFLILISGECVMIGSNPNAAVVCEPGRSVSTR